MRNCVLLIPAYNPDTKLLTLLEQLQSAEFEHVVLVDDGSRAECGEVFRRAVQFPGVTLLRHAVNLGKGAALKTGLNHIFAAWPESKGIITADSDGQHTPADILKLDNAAGEHPEDLILGVRAFDRDVPFRSKFGNRLTSFLMLLLLGIRVSDTQTGLRFIPRGFIPELLPVRYDRYEFELEMILLARRTKRVISEVTIQTVYLDNNASSHFNPVLDSLKIYVVLFRYILVSAVTALADYAVFAPVLALTSNEIGAVAAGRCAGAALQYCLVRKVVFSSREKVLTTLPKYVALVICSGCASYLIMHSIAANSGINAYIAKLAAETVLYLANFLIQRDMIFSPSGHHGRNE